MGDEYFLYFNPCTNGPNGTVHTQTLWFYQWQGGDRARQWRSSNFIQSRLATYLNLAVQPSTHMWATVRNGDALSYGGECSAIKLKLGDTIFAIDLILLPIYDADLVLGVQWMQTLGPILFDYDQLWMEFTHYGERFRLHGVNPIQYVIALTALFTKSGGDATQFYHLKVEPITSDPTP